MTAGTQKTDVAQKLRAFIEKRFPLVVSNQLSDDDSLLDGGAIDSLGLLDIVTFLEEDMSVQVEDDDMVPDNFDSIARIEQFVASKHG